MESTTCHRRSAGNVVPVLLVLVLLMGVGGWNYQRNLKKEPPRPYSRYADGEIDQLVDAYQRDVGQRAGSLPPARGKDTRGKGAMLSDHVADFEAAQRRGDAYRAANGALAGQEAVLRQLQKEQALRAEGPWALHLKRLTKI